MTAFGPLLLAAAIGGLQGVTPEVIAEIRVHGNVIVTNDDVVKIAGIAVGEPFVPSTIADVTTRLRESKKFQHIEVLKRFASITDFTKIVVVIVVNEGAVRIDLPEDPSGQVAVVKRRGLHNLMIMPILDGEDGYGITFGARLAFVNMAGRKNRLSFPLTWGGLKQAGAEYEQPLAAGPISRVSFGGAIQRQKNPAFQIDDDRQRTWGRVERAIGHVRLGGDLRLAARLVRRPDRPSPNLRRRRHVRHTDRSDPAEKRGLRPCIRRARDLRYPSGHDPNTARGPRVSRAHRPDRSRGACRSRGRR